MTLQKYKLKQTVKAKCRKALDRVVSTAQILSNVSQVRCYAETLDIEPDDVHWKLAADLSIDAHKRWAMWTRRGNSDN